MNQLNSLWFAVLAKCGHVGRHYYIVKEFLIPARNKREAALKARCIPRVKHDRKDAILKVSQIDSEEASRRLKLRHDDPYFCCRNRLDQRILCPDWEEIRIREPTPKKYWHERNKEVINFKHRKEKEQTKARLMAPYEYKDNDEFDDSINLDESRVDTNRYSHTGGN